MGVLRLICILPTLVGLLALIWVGMGCYRSKNVRVDHQLGKQIVCPWVVEEISKGCFGSIRIMSRGLIPLW